MKAYVCIAMLLFGVVHTSDYPEGGNLISEVNDLKNLQDQVAELWKTIKNMQDAIKGQNQKVDECSSYCKRSEEFDLSKDWNISNNISTSNVSGAENDSMTMNTAKDSDQARSSIPLDKETRKFTCLTDTDENLINITLKQTVNETDVTIEGIVKYVPTVLLNETNNGPTAADVYELSIYDGPLGSKCQGDRKSEDLKKIERIKSWSFEDNDVILVNTTLADTLTNPQLFVNSYIAIVNTKEGKHLNCCQILPSENTSRSILIPTSIRFNG